MRISAKGRYALAAMTDIALHSADGSCITVISISERLGISKIYLEQVFSLLKKGRLVHSVKGAQGGYQLARPPQQITAYDILFPVETALFEETENVVSEDLTDFENILKNKVFYPLGEAVKNTLQSVTLDDLRAEIERRKSDGFMFYI